MSFVPEESESASLIYIPHRVAVNHLLTVAYSLHCCAYDNIATLWYGKYPRHSTETLFTE